MGISLLDIGYAAGLYEGEGSIQSTSNRLKKIYCYVSMTQKDPEPLVKMQKLFGDEIKVYGGYNYWRLYGIEMREFVLTIFSLLSSRRRNQILQYKEQFTTPDACPNGHVYENGSYRIVKGPGGYEHRQCLECYKLNIDRKNEKRRNVSPDEEMIKFIAKRRGVSLDEAKKILEKSEKLLDM
jgi:hypothetical protein